MKPATIEPWIIEYALDSPTWNVCRMILLDALHGCQGACNVYEIRASEAYRRDALRLRIDLAGFTERTGK